MLREFIADVLAPRACFGCEVEGSWLCDACREGIERESNATCVGCEQLSPFGATCERCRPDLPFAGVVAVANYRDQVIQRIIQTVKYAPTRDAAGAFASLVANFLSTAIGRSFRERVGSPPILIPVPLDRIKRGARGFNQSTCIAAALAGTGFGTVIEGAIVRRWRLHAVPQVALARANRFANVAGAFRCRTPDALRGRPVVIVDDVVTTGATMAACGRAIRDAGVRSPIWCFALARG